MVLSGVIVFTVGAALLLTRRGGADADRGRVRSSKAASRRWAAGVRSSPGVALAAVTCLIYANQVLFTIYVLRVRHGDPSFIARHLPDGWFALAHGPAIEALARHFPAPGLLAPSVLRVQAFLELPFVVFAYLVVCRWFSPDVYRRALRLAWPVAISYTVTFGLIEWSLHNPYTVDDIAIRCAAAVITPLWVARLDGAAAERAHTLPGLLVFAASTTALGVLVLVVYDTALLYNLGHLDGRLSIVGVALLVLAAVRGAARFISDRSPGSGLDSIARTFGHLLVLFFVPALPVRYGLGFGAVYVSAAGAAVLIAVTVVLGVRESFARVPGRPMIWLGQMTVAFAAGLCGAATALLLRGGYAETRLLWATAAFFGCAISVCALIDRIVDGRGPSGPSRSVAHRPPESSASKT